MRTFMLAALCAAFLVSAAQAQTFQTVLSTPDISVTATATIEVTLNHVRGGVDWVAIKNDCAEDLYFDLRDVRDASARQYPLRLAQDNSFSAQMRVYSIQASPAAGNTVTCTFTLIMGKF